MYSIGQVSAMTNLPISTLRYYDKEGFFPNLEKQSGIRRFSKTELDSIRMIEPQGYVRSPQGSGGGRNETTGKNAGYAEIQMLVL